MAGERLTRAGLAALLLAALLPPAARADGGRAHQGADGVATVDALIGRLREDYPGRLLKLEMEEDDGRAVYEVRLLTDDGRVVELELDARDLRLLGRRAGHHSGDRDESDD